MKPMLRAAVCGAGWGLLVGGIFPAEIDDPFPRMGALLLGAALGAPIGLLIYALSRWLYRGQSWLGLVLWSVVTLYLGAALWGAGAYGVHRLLFGPLRGAEGSAGAEMLLGAFSYWWGMTFIWPLSAVLLLLAMATHFWIGVNEPDRP